MKEKRNRTWLTHEIAKRANFTLGDVRIILNTFEDIVKETLINDDILLFNRLFKVEVGTIKEHNGPEKGYTPVSGEEFRWGIVPEKKRAKISPAKSLRLLFGENLPANENDEVDELDELDEE